MTTDIRGLSIRQPWAWAVCAGVKHTENRTWTTSFRGTIAIHASTSLQVVNAFRRESGYQQFNGEYFTTGAIIGLADIVEIASYGLQHETDPFAEGPYCWTMANPRFLRIPIPLKGKLNLFKIDAAVQEQLRIAETFVIDLEQDSDAKAVAQAIYREPDPIASYLELYAEHLHSGNHQDALGVAGQRLIELAPDEPTGYLIRGALRLDEPTQNTPNSSDLIRASELSPDDPNVWYLLSMSYLDEKRHEKSFEAADRLVSLSPEWFSAFETRARAHYHVQSFQACIEDCDRSIELNAENAICWAMRGEAKAAVGDRDGAKEDLDHAVALAPDNEYLSSLRDEALLR